MEKFVFPMSFRGSPRQFKVMGSLEGYKTYMVYRSSSTAPAYEGNIRAM
jgi:hypothetical protein